MKFRPLPDRVLIRRLDHEEKTSRDIIILAGDRVLFGKWTGAEVKIDGEDFTVMKETDILGMIDSGGAARAAA